MNWRWLNAAEILERTEDDILAYMAFQQEHRPYIYSTNLLERLKNEVKRNKNSVVWLPH
jgi:putative transposase